jgi:hypothetical protein
MPWNKTKVVVEKPKNAVGEQCPVPKHLSMPTIISITPIVNHARGRQP